MRCQQSQAKDPKGFGKIVDYNIIYRKNIIELKVECKQFF